MARKRVLYFFAFASPFAALADFRIDQFAEVLGFDLDPIPLVPPPSPQPTGMAAQLREYKLDYLREDAARCAHKLHIPWVSNPPGPIESRDAVAGYYYARQRGQGRDFRNAVFRSRWCQGKDIDDHAVLAECAEDCRFSGNEFLQAVRSRVYHADIDANLERCLEHRVFGVPTFVLNGKRFWGNDRIDFLVDEIKSAE